MFANNLQNYCKMHTARSTPSTMKSHLECATQNTLQIVFATQKNQKPLDYATQNFLATTSVQLKKRFALRKNTLRKFPYCLNLQLSTQQVCHRRTTTLQLLHQRLHHFEQKNGTFNKCKRAQTCICASDQNGCFHLYVCFWRLRKNGFVAFCTVARQKIASKNPHTGCGF